MDKKENLKRNYRIYDFVEKYSISRTKAYQEIQAGRLKTFKCGRITLISVEAAEDWQKSLENAEMKVS